MICEAAQLDEQFFREHLAYDAGEPEGALGGRPKLRISAACSSSR